jgi:uncharacterized membrane protein YccF (DUF307 family)
MGILANLLWIILGGGIFVFLLYLIGGIVLCATIIGIPFGVQLIKLSMLGLWPFGRRVDTTGSAENLLGIIMNILWWAFGGIEVAIVHLVFALLMAITIIGLPFAKQHLKLFQLALVPFGARIRQD